MIAVTYKSAVVIGFHVEHDIAVLDYLPWTRYMLTRLRDEESYGELTSQQRQAIEYLRMTEALIRYHTYPVRSQGNSHIVETITQINANREIRGYWDGNRRVVWVGYTLPAIVALQQISEDSIVSLCGTLDRRLSKRLERAPTPMGKILMGNLIGYISGRNTLAANSILQSDFAKSTISDLFSNPKKLRPFVKKLHVWVKGFAKSRGVSPEWVMKRLGVEYAEEDIEAEIRD